MAYVDPDKKPQIAKVDGVRSYGTIFVQANGKREEAKSLSEEEITGALIRTLKSGQRTACAVAGSGEHSLDDTERTSYSALKELLQKNNYTTRGIKLLEKPEVPKDCTVLIVGGPRFDYVQPVVDAIKSYVESGGRALIMLDPPLKLGKEDIAENAALTKMLEGWGVTMDKNLVLDTSGIGQLFGLGPEMPLVTAYESHAIVREMKESATAFPLSRSLEVKPADKVTAEKLFSTTASSVATQNLGSREIRLNPATDKKRPAGAGRRRLLQFRQGGRGGPLRGGWVIGLGGEQRPALQWEPRPVPEHDELALVGRGSDFDSSQGTHGPPFVAQPASDGHDLLLERGWPALAGDPGRHGRVVAEEIGDAVPRIAGGRRGAGRPGRRCLLVQQGEEGAGG